MANDKNRRPVPLQEGYQANGERGYQPDKVEGGYQTSNVVPENVKPPSGGSAIQRPEGEKQKK